VPEDARKARILWLYKVRELMECLEADLGTGLGELLVDGGLCHNDILMQIQVKLLRVEMVFCRYS
jgi:glycerol kinase